MGATAEVALFASTTALMLLSATSEFWKGLCPPAIWYGIMSEPAGKPPSTSTLLNGKNSGWFIKGAALQRRGREKNTGSVTEAGQVAVAETRD